MSNPYFVGTAAALLSLVLTYVVRSLASRYGFVAKPTSDRWHKRPTAMLGGIAIFITTLIVYFLLVPFSLGSAVVMGASSFLFFVGLVDDILTIRPYQKLIGQLIGAGILVMYGLKLPITGLELVDIWITVFWVVGITNAINLLDNMDGLAAGISAIAAISLALNFATNGMTNELLLTCALIGALIGFLFFNFNPASIFMGDCGSMFIGFLLSASVLLNQVGGRSRGILAILAVPALILFVPIFDTAFVTVIRKMWGRKASQGGRDHTSHRLVALGLTERSAVLMLYAFAVAAGTVSIILGQIGPFKGFALVGFFIVVLVIIGVYLSKVKVYEVEDADKAASENALFAFLVNVSYKRRIFEVFLDAFLITLAYYTAFAILFDSFESSTNWTLFLQTLPILVVIKLGAFLVIGVYRGLWKYTSIGDLITFAKAVALGSILSVLAILLIYRFEGFSRTVFFLDGILLLLLVVGSRLAFRVIRQVLPLPVNIEGQRVLIYGAGDGGELVLRELINNPSWNYNAVGFIDDDPLKKDKLIHGLRVFGSEESVEAICSEAEIAGILISARNIPADRLRDLRESCRRLNVTLMTAYIKIEPVDFG
jgi:UDP-GlcNAc:undecaprenyl-phosphate/decaprenyl-phosphate GlcNAc-1-phosphate transferase